MRIVKAFDQLMLAPCGVNCAVCYKHISAGKPEKACAGCRGGDHGKTKRCRDCAIKACALGKGVSHCHECPDFPCRRIKNLDKSYRQRYRVSPIVNGHCVREKGLAAFMRDELTKWTCRSCGGLVSQHDGACSECGAKHRVEPPSSELDA